MSVHTFPVLDRYPELLGVLPSIIVAPTSVTADESGLSLTFEPDLTPEQAQTLGRLVAFCRAPRDMALADWLALEPFLATERALVQMAQADWMALTANARERLTFDVLTALCRVDLRQLRD
jgi:hypothetical protein